MKVSIGKYFKNSANRNISVQIDKYDTWSLDNTLAHIIYPALLQLKATKHGVPTDFAMVGGEDYLEQMCFDFYSETYSESFDERIKDWDLVLDKMIWAFRQLAIEDYDDQYHHGDNDFDFVPTGDKILNPATGKLEETFSVEYKNKDYFFDAVGLQEHEKRIQEGLELFGKYYRALWD